MENINDKIKFTDIATANNTASKKLKINENQISKIDGYVASISTEAKEDTSVIIPAETKEITAPEYSEEFEKAVSDTIGEPVTVEQSEMDSWTDFATQLQEETEDKAITDIPEIITDPEREKIVEATRKAIDEELQREETVVKASPSRPIRYSFEEPVAPEEKEETVFDQIGKKAAEIQEERKQNEISIPGKMAVIDNDDNYKDLIAKIEEKRAELKKQNEINTAKRADTSTQNKIAEKYKAAIAAINSENNRMKAEITEMLNKELNSVSEESLAAQKEGQMIEEQYQEGLAESQAASKRLAELAEINAGIKVEQAEVKKFVSSIGKTA